MAGMDMYIVFIAKRLGSSGNKCILCVDQPGDIIGDASGGKRGVRPPLKDGNCHVRLQSARLGRRTHSGCIAAYYYEFCQNISPVLLRLLGLCYAENSVPDIILVPAFQDKNRLGMQKFDDFFRFAAQQTG